MRDKEDDFYMPAKLLPDAKESARPPVWPSHPHHARQGRGRLQRVCGMMPNAKESTGRASPSPELLHPRYARQGTARLPHVRFAMPNLKQSIRPSGLSHLHRGVLEKEAFELYLSFE